MKRNLYLLISCIIIFSNPIIGQLQIPALSPSSRTIQTVGLTSIEIEYSRPSKRERTIFGKGGLLPNGEIWRTGANAATKITFSDNIKIFDTTLEKGSYTILTKPDTASWEVYFYTYESSNWNSYVNSKPIARFTANINSLKDTMETFMIYIDQISLDSAQLVFAWENSKVMLPLKVEVHNKTMANIEKTLSGPTSFDYFQVALYLHEVGKDLDKALIYIQKATKSKNPLFFQVYREALILADLGRKTEAIGVAKQSLELSKKARNKDFIRLNEKFIEKWER
ncbi:DUF2911 domain-containing protein [Aquimarina sp. MMG016]|uniref:DUF2911 domain-containing protein n=1 Tax=Aquimarina sp. MMG016 TaxID=2822690 RepID=UPI001B3A0BC7|nr:DUF2911 domain-containing protein [Aquimarina sp. MMG016]MBQ4818982.1 DUF2911 domain-containing protein [Aquimarina sp. MMG016]